ncbi:type 2 periplasmic-binding domain-containing protein [Streptomonospora nanhaiensis]|uniref:hypothetical protein n=1 Tax=Streptomonospora nanhaiensis TaxID=1323731 RepID=UPI001C38E492|nr:hypothetical protein [Streptomonospora nanhaiensis]MBV2364496.1 hypothetical protein [Streptomonospora nanhaiensis]
MPRLARLHGDWPVRRIPLGGEHAPVRRVLAVTRLGGRGHPAAAAALDTIARTAKRLLPRPRAPSGG